MSSKSQGMTSNGSAFEELQFRIEKFLEYRIMKHSKRFPKSLVADVADEELRFFVQDGPQVDSVQLRYKWLNYGF